MEINQIILTFIAGIIIASTVTALGLGGGIMWAPFILLVFALPVKNIVSTSLVIQTFGLGSATMRYSTQKNIQWPLAFKVAFLGLPGIFIGVSLLDKVHPVFFDLALGTIALVIAFLFVYELDTVTVSSVKTHKKNRIFYFIPLLTLLTSMFSVGIGDYLVPYFKKKMKMSMRRSIGTSIAFMFIIAAFTSSLLLFFGYKINWLVALPASAGVVVGGQLGPRINGFLSENTLKEIFTFSLLLIGIHLIYNTF